MILLKFLFLSIPVQSTTSISPSIPPSFEAEFGSGSLQNIGLRTTAMSLRCMIVFNCCSSLPCNSPPNTVHLLWACDHCLSCDNQNNDACGIQGQAQSGSVHSITIWPYMTNTYLDYYEDGEFDASEDCDTSSVVRSSSYYYYWGRLSSGQSINVNSIPLVTLFDIGNVPDHYACPSPPPSLPPPPSPVGAYQDPHLHFAHGGVADFRGTHNDYYNFLSVPGLSVNMKIENATFRYKHAEVHGSFMTEMSLHAIVGGPKKKVIKISHIAAQSNEQNWGWRMVNGTCGGHHFYLGPEGIRHCEEFSAKTYGASSVIRVHDWVIWTSTNYIYDRIHGPKHRIDIAIQLNTTEKSMKVAPHGIIGQSYDNDMYAVDGKQDIYPNFGTFYTSAQAEGAIEGDYTMYKMNGRYDTDFKFSRFDATYGQPRSLKNLNIRKVKNIDYIARATEETTVNFP